MKPYFSRSGVDIYLDDCLLLLPDLPTATASLVLADPPYGETSLDWDVADWRWLGASLHCLCLDGSVWCFGSMRMFLAAGRDLLQTWHLAQDLVWEKQNGSSFHADRFRRVHEHVIQLYPDCLKWEDVYTSTVTTPDATARTVRRKERPPHTGNIANSTYTSQDGGPRLMRSVIRVANCHGDADHPTQKPLGILRPLIEYSCPPGGLVLDPTCGVGSTLVAAMQMGRRAIGIELREDYCELAAKRLERELPWTPPAAPEPKMDRQQKLIP